MARCPSGRRLSFLPRAGMSFVVDTGEVLKIKMGVNLGRRNIGVAQQLLHATQIPTRFKEMRCKRMPEQVGVYAQAHALSPSPISHPCLHSSPAQTLAATPDEQSGFARLSEPRALFQPFPEGLERLLPDWHNAFFFTFSNDPDCPVGNLQAVDIEAAELREPEAGRVQQLH